jgi:tRNA pseudouridine38-40 synthase
MDKSKLINTYFDAIKIKDIIGLKTLLGEGFGIRTFFGKLIFSYEDLEATLDKFNLITYDIIDLELSSDIGYVYTIIEYSIDSVVMNECIVVKFVFKDNKIIRVFETIKKVGYTRIRCTVTYDGSTFSGFQRQPDLMTVQGEIEKALFYLTKEEITIHSSGRTDKGVHAINQTFHFDTLSKIEPNDFARVLRSYLPDSIYLKSSEKVHATFHSRYDSYSKEYVYKLNLGEYDPIQREYEWNVNDIDVVLLKKELSSIIGTHDFTSFTKTKEDKIMTRTIFDINVEEKGDYLYISIIGSGFLRYMVRYIIGTVVEIAKGNTKETLIDFINYKNSSEVKWKAPSSGLYLKEVIYYD